MSAYDLQNCPAGLDNIPPIHDMCPSNPITSAVFDGFSRGAVTGPAKRRTVIGRDRPPLVDKSPDFNVPSTNHRTSKETAFQPEHLALGGMNDFTTIMNEPNLESVSCHPTTHPFTSCMQLPSFLDFSFHTMTTLPDLTPTGRSPQPLLYAFQPTTTERYNEVEPDTLIPSATHPNSPYVPWAPQVRQEILQPLTAGSHMSYALDRYSRPLSRAGAQAPEPTEFRPESSRSGNKFLRVSRNIRNIKVTVKKNVEFVAKYIKRLRKVRSTHTNIQIHEQENLKAFQPNSPTSFDSVETNTLVTWLQGRQYAAQERGREVSHYASLDEYERAGSWLDLSHNHHDNTTDASHHPLRQASNPTLIDTSFTHQPFRISWLQEGHSISCPSTPIKIQPHTKFPAGRDSDLLRSLDLIYRDSPQSVIQDFGSPRGRTRELNMPGGWTFN